MASPIPIETSLGADATIFARLLAQGSNFTIRSKKASLQQRLGSINNFSSISVRWKFGRELAWKLAWKLTGELTGELRGILGWKRRWKRRWNARWSESRALSSDGRHFPPRVIKTESQIYVSKDAFLKEAGNGGFSWWAQTSVTLGAASASCSSRWWRVVGSHVKQARTACAMANSHDTKDVGLASISAHGWRDGAYRLDASIEWVTVQILGEHIIGIPVIVGSCLVGRQ